MKRSVQVSAPLLAAAALSLTTGCRKPQMQRCVDENNHVVADSFCQNPTHPPFHVMGAQCFDAQNHAVAMSLCNTPLDIRPTSTGFVYIPMYRYYYGGVGSYGIGSVVSGGGYTPSSGVSYANSSGSTTRGGFGSSFGGSSSGSGSHSSGGGE